MTSILEHFDALSKLGLQVIPLRPNSKIPIDKNWQINYSYKSARFKFQIMPEANAGLLLGNVIDVEGDTPRANEIINELIGDYPHPRYQSNKSTHHLFISPDNNLRILKFDNIEFRGFGHQSVLPPSTINNIKYQWYGGVHFPIPEMPKDLFAFYRKSLDKKLNRYTKKPGHIRVRCSSCKEHHFLHQKRFNLELEVFKLLSSPWQCRNCRNLDIRKACRLMRVTDKTKIELDKIKEAAYDSV